MNKIPISLSIIAYNEESNIERCIRSVPFANDVIVVDSFSSDKTAEIAEKWGARVIQEKWKGYGAQKQFATDQAVNDWVISLDADEALSPELAAEVLEIFSTLHPEVGYWIPRRSFHLGKWIRYGGWTPDYQLRLFNKKWGRWSQDQLHERVVIKKTEKLKNPILHWVFDDLSDQVKTNDKYSTLGALEFIQNGKKFYLWKLLLKPPTKFLETYIFKLGILDGMAGFIIAVSAAYSVFLKWAKLWEKEIKK